MKHSATSAEPQNMDDQNIQELRREIIDLKIANRGKYYLVEQLKCERSGFLEKNNVCQPDAGSNGIEVASFGWVEIVTFKHASLHLGVFACFK